MKRKPRILLQSTLSLLLALALGACRLACAESAALSSPIQPLAEHIVLDNSSEMELVITNNDTHDQDIEKLTLTKLEQVKGWKKSALPFQAEVRAAAQVTQLDPALIHAVIATESGYNPRALSPKGAYGLMQVLPTTAQTMTSVPVRQWSVPQQILWGSHYLKQLMDMFEGNVTLALAAYNAGPQAVKSHQHSVPPYAETRQYVPKVLGYYHVFKTRLNQPSD